MERTEDEPNRGDEAPAPDPDARAGLEADLRRDLKDDLEADIRADIEQDRTATIRDVIVLLVLTATAVITAWCGFEASKWGGEMSIAFSQASSSRIQAARAQGEANTARQIDLNLWTLYVQARAESDSRLARYVEDRFTDRFQVAFEAWQQGGQQADSPFDLAAYKPPGSDAAAAADKKADQRFADGLTNNARGDQYTLLTVLFALVLFFAAVSPRPARPRIQWALVGLALLVFLVGMIQMVQLPVII
ncbi:hypothetical protein [Microlunatus soli]|uniref:DUF4337 domain-containing protein n=1 Tax=Microlunatus soli TaxID=630515 RepID=A0A1H1YX34_9ACTN|nr:hypothetical protein [Microlunatus soli]SDT26024.1 hypothetical protein SAMN04489812_4839 [Microlunatus soli]